MIERAKVSLYLDESLIRKIEKFEPVPNGDLSLSRKVELVLRKGLEE